MARDVSEGTDGAEQPAAQVFESETVTVNDRGDVIARQTHTATQFIEDCGDGTPLEMVVIPGGTFLMGSRAGFGYEDEHPQHTVRVTSFLLGKVPVTQEQWQAVMGWTPPYRCRGARRPVDRISWYDAEAFCERLWERTGRAYRLPSEAEWEYACRAGTTTPFYCGETITTGLANYVGDHIYRAEPKGTYRHETTEVGSFPANGFGLYDMHGNVWEWCADAWHKTYTGAPVDGSVWEGETGAQRVLRGGCWHDPPDLCRSAARFKHVPHEGEDYFSFRVALASFDHDPTGTIRHSRANPTGRMRLARRLARRVRAWLGR